MWTHEVPHPQWFSKISSEGVLVNTGSQWTCSYCSLWSQHCQLTCLRKFLVLKLKVQHVMLPSSPRKSTGCVHASKQGRWKGTARSGILSKFPQHEEGEIQGSAMRSEAALGKARLSSPQTVTQGTFFLSWSSIWNYWLACCWCMEQAVPCRAGAISLSPFLVIIHSKANTWKKIFLSAKLHAL